MEFLAQILLEIVAYGVGRIFVTIFMPWYRVEPVARHDPNEEARWKWRGITRVDEGKRVVQAETAQLIGVVVIIGIGIMVYRLLR